MEKQRRSRGRAASTRVNAAVAAHPAGFPWVLGIPFAASWGVAAPCRLRQAPPPPSLGTSLVRATSDLKQE